MSPRSATSLFKHLLRRMHRRVRPEASGTSEAEACLALILRTPAIATELLSEEQMPAAPIGVHILVQDAHVLSALWVLKSFEALVEERLPAWPVDGQKVVT